MEKYFDILKENPLFKDIEKADIARMLMCMQAKAQEYSKGQIILQAGTSAKKIGIVLRGSAQVSKATSDGKQSILAEITTGRIFGEVFACAGADNIPVTVTASQSTTVLLLNYTKAIASCSSACPFHLKLIENMLALLANKNLMINQKIELLSKRTTRQRLLIFLQQQSEGKSQIDVSFSREELADYLCVERSALCAEISKMQKDGLIKCNRRSFIIL